MVDWRFYCSNCLEHKYITSDLEPIECSVDATHVIKDTVIVSKVPKEEVDVKKIISELIEVTELKVNSLGQTVVGKANYQSDLELSDSNKGIVMPSANGKKWVACMSDTGAWIITEETV